MTSKKQHFPEATVHVNSESMKACKRSAQVKGRWSSIPERGKWTSGPAPNQEVTYN